MRWLNGPSMRRKQEPTSTTSSFSLKGFLSSCLSYASFSSEYKMWRARVVKSGECQTMPACQSSLSPVCGLPLVTANMRHMLFTLDVLHVPEAIG